MFAIADGTAGDVAGYPAALPNQPLLVPSFGAVDKAIAFCILTIVETSYGWKALSSLSRWGALVSVAAGVGSVWRL